MRVVHDPAGDRRALATDVDVAESFGEKTRGLMGKSSIPDEYALVFHFHDPDFLHRLFDTIPRQYIHMLFVRMPLDVLWLREDEVVKTATLSPWTGIGAARADTIIELPEGAAEGVEVGDTVVIEDDESGAGSETDADAAA
jgi:uncharacterized membrane protein (UPF0127 family)